MAQSGNARTHTKTDGHFENIFPPAAHTMGVGRSKLDRYYFCNRRFHSFICHWNVTLLRKQMEVEFICSLSDITPARSLQKSVEEENPFDWNCSEKSQRTTWWGEEKNENEAAGRCGILHYGQRAFNTSTARQKTSFDAQQLPWRIL